MSDLFLTKSADFEDRAIEPARELGAYEALWAREGTTFKSVAQLFAKHPGAIPSDFVSQAEAAQ